MASSAFGPKGTPFGLKPEDLDPFGHPKDPFFRTMEQALTEYSAIAQSHATEPKKKARMVQLLGQVQALMGSGKAKQPPVKAKIDELMSDLMALSPVSARPGMKPIPNIDDVRTRKAHWELVRIGNAYHIRVPGQQQTTLANGSYVFAIPTSCPWEVRVGERATGGHTAITRGADVYFAGEIAIENGAIKEWNNDSGHYRPDTVLHPQARNLLPLNAYKRKV